MKAWRYKWHCGRDEWRCYEVEITKKTPGMVVFAKRYDATDYHLKMRVNEFEQLFGLSPVHARNIALKQQAEDFNHASSIASRELSKLQALQNISEFRLGEK